MSKLVLVVEDDDDVRETAVMALREHGYDVIQAMTGGIALVLLRQELPIDILFTDIVMPGEPDGYELARQAKSILPRIKILYATGFSATKRTAETPILGTILPKPYRPRQLTEALEKLFR